MPEYEVMGIEITADSPLSEVVAKIEERLQDAMPDGLKVSLTLEDEDLLRQVLKPAKGFLNSLPEDMRTMFIEKMQERLDQYGATFKGVEWNYRFAPRVTWEYKGQEYKAFFYLDGEFHEGDGWLLRNADEHTFASLITRVIPDAYREGRARED